MHWRQFGFAELTDKDPKDIAFADTKGEIYFNFCIQYP